MSDALYKLAQSKRRTETHGVPDPEPEDYCMGCGYIICRCKQPHAFTPDARGFCIHCGMYDPHDAVHTSQTAPTQQTNPDDNLFVRVQSWDDNKIHPTMNKMKGKKVVVTVRVED